MMENTSMLEAALHQHSVQMLQRQLEVKFAEAEWLAIQETLYLLSIPNMRESILAGLATPLNECSTELEW